MTDQMILQRLNEIFIDIFDDDSIVLTPATNSNDIDNWDSFNQINVIVAAEMRFGMKFNTAEIDALKNVGEMVSLIRRHANAGAAHA